MSLALEHTKREPADPQGSWHLASTAWLCNTGTARDLCISQSRPRGEWFRLPSGPPGPSHPARTSRRTDAAPAGGPARPSRSANAAPHKRRGRRVPRAFLAASGPPGAAGYRRSRRPGDPPRGSPQGARNLRAAPLSGGSGSRRLTADETAPGPPGSRPPLRRRPSLRAHPPARPPPAPTSKKPALPPILRAAAAPSPASRRCRSGGAGPAEGTRGERERPAPPRRAPPLLAPPRPGKREAAASPPDPEREASVARPCGYRDVRFRSGAVLRGALLAGAVVSAGRSAGWRGAPGFCGL